MLKKKTPETISAKLTIQSLGETIELPLVYRNVKFDEYLEKSKELTFGDLILWLVQSWESEYPLTLEGITELEVDRPGMLETILTSWIQARKANAVKN